MTFRKQPTAQISVGSSSRARRGTIIRKSRTTVKQIPIKDKRQSLYFIGNYLLYYTSTIIEPKKSRAYIIISK